VAISPYIKSLREKVGRTRLLIPSVSAHIFDDSNRLLLVRQHDDDVWSTPGGAIEPDEAPVDAVAREVLEETGLIVDPVQLITAYGGPEFTVTYPNGDETQYVILAYRCVVRGGELRTFTDETSNAGYFSQDAARTIQLAAWLKPVLNEIYARQS